MGYEPQQSLAAQAIDIQGFNCKLRVSMRSGETNGGDKPFLIARVGLNRLVLLAAAASAAGCVKSGSGGLSWVLHTTDLIDIEMR